MQSSPEAHEAGLLSPEGLASPQSETVYHFGSLIPNALGGSVESNFQCLYLYDREYPRCGYF